MTTEPEVLDATLEPESTSAGGELVRINRTTGEIVPDAPVVDPYVGIAAQPVSRDAAAILRAPIPDEDLDVLPTGEVYPPQVLLRRRLLDAFGPGGWGLMPRGPVQIRGNILCREYALYGHGRFLSEAIGEQEYRANNPRMTYATAAEAAKSNALVRCCKDLGIASECWDKKFTTEWKRRYAERIDGQWKKKPVDAVRQIIAAKGRILERAVASTPTAEPPQPASAPAPTPQPERASAAPPTADTRPTPDHRSAAPPRVAEPQEPTAATGIYTGRYRVARVRPMPYNAKGCVIDTVDGPTMSVWNDSFRELALDALSSTSLIAFSYVKSGKFLNVKSMEIVDEPRAAEPQEPAPAASTRDTLVRRGKIVGVRNAKKPFIVDVTVIKPDTQAEVDLPLQYWHDGVTLQQLRDLAGTDEWLELTITAGSGGAKVLDSYRPWGKSPEAHP